jgi:PAS domain-containing protein
MMWCKRSPNANGQNVVDFECRCQREDGSIVWVSWNATPYQESNYWYSVGRDISLRKSQSAVLLQSERKFSAIFNQTFQLMGLVSLDGVLLEVNHSETGSIVVSIENLVGVIHEAAVLCLGFPPLAEPLRQEI